MTTPEGLDPAGKGEPLNAESAPVLALTEYADTVLPTWFAM
jgi:hypothetical protein